MLEKLKIFDAISKLIPGILLMSFLTPFIVYMYELNVLFEKVKDYKDFSTLLTTIFLVFSFVLGYFISAIASSLEDWLFILWGGRASSLLLRDKVKGKKLSNPVEMFGLLTRETNDSSLLSKPIEKFEEKDFAKLFQTAKNYCLKNIKEGKFAERIEDFGNAYIFSRNLFFTILIIFILTLTLLIKIPFSQLIWGITFLLFTLYLSFRRCKQQSIYHTREIFSAFRSFLILTNNA